MTNGNGKATKEYIIYLDSSVLISFTEADSDSISELLSMCKAKNVVVRISPYTVMESLNIKQEHKYFMKKVSEGMALKKVISNRRERDLTTQDLKGIFEVLRRKLKPHGMEFFHYPLDANWWKLALDITRDSNVNSSDAIHLAQSVFMGCDLLVSTDNFFIENGINFLKEYLKNEKLVICRPEKAVEILKVIS